MAPALLFALALLAADPAEAPVADTPVVDAAPVDAPPIDAPVADAPVEAPAPEPVAEAPAPAPAADPLANVPYPTGAPTDDYGLVAWCYGALSTHMGLHDKVLPEVERIEGQWSKGPGDLKEAMASYEEQRVEGVRAVAQFRRAMEAAEKASIKPIQEEGVAALKKGASTWAAANRVDKRRLAQEWMSWGLPGRCVPTAQALEKKAALLGQALSYNAKETPPPAPEPVATDTVDAIVAEALAETPAPEEAPAVAEEAPAADEAIDTGAETVTEEAPAVVEETPAEAPKDEAAAPEAAIEPAPEAVTEETPVATEEAPPVEPAPEPVLEEATPSLRGAQ